MLPAAPTTVALTLSLSSRCAGMLASSWNARVIIFDNYRHSCGKLCAPYFILCFPYRCCFPQPAVAHLICRLDECNSCQAAVSVSHLQVVQFSPTGTTTAAAATASAVVAVSLLFVYVKCDQLEGCNHSYTWQKSPLVLETTLLCLCLHFSQCTSSSSAGFFFYSFLYSFVRSCFRSHFIL